MLLNKNIEFDNANKSYLLNNLYYLLLGFLALILFTMPLGNVTYLRISLNAFIYLNVVMFLASLNLKFKKQDRFSILIIFFVSLILLFSMLINNSFNSNTIAVGLGYMSSYLMVYYSERILITKKTIYLITFFTLLITAIYIYFFYSPIAYRFIATGGDVFYKEVNIDALTLGYQNSNTTASVLGPVSMVLLVLSKLFTKKLIKFSSISLSLILLYFIFLTQSRSTFFAVTIFHILVFFKINIKITKTLVAAFILSILLFVFTYSLLYSSKIGLDWVILGKDFFSGRQVFLSTTFFEASSSWLLGDIQTYRYGNMLNGMLSIYASGGMLNIILYTLFFTYHIAKRFDKNNQLSYVPLLAILVFYIQSFGEGNFMVTGAYFTVLLSLLYVLTNVRVNKSSVQK